MALDRPAMEDRAGASDQMIALMESRAHFYRLLSRVFAREMDAEALAVVGGEKASMAATRELSRRGYEALRDFFKKADETASEAVLLDLAVEYAALFLGTGSSRGRSAVPYASVYLSEDRRMMQEPFIRIRSFYARAGYARVDGARELDDHIAVVIEFLGHMADGTARHLARGEVEAAVERLALQEAFLSEHVCTWAPTFCRDVSRFDKTGFYKGFALITRAFLKADWAMVAEAKQEIETGLAVTR